MQKIFTDKVELIYAKEIALPQVEAFTRRAVHYFGNDITTEQSNKVADIVWQKFESLGYIVKEARQQFIDLTLSACYIYNLFYREDDISTLFLHRTKLKEIAEDCELPEQVAKVIYEICESQLGENHPIQRLKPVSNSPSQTFADAVWFVNTYKPSIE